MGKYVLNFNEINKDSLPYVGGKGANLGEMTQAGFPIPRGFCITTMAYRRLIEESNEIDKFFDLLDQIKPDNLKEIAKLGKKIRDHLKSLVIPEDIRLAILKAWNLNGNDKSYAVRSSATAEDLPTASFAGQQDTYLNIRGQEELIEAIQRCWASLFTDRAISYRIKNEFDQRSVQLSVVVQEMVFPEVSGIMFTADPITGHRNTFSLDASFGLGEALVSGLVTADLYQVRDGKLIKKQISCKKIAICSKPEGGTVEKEIPCDRQEKQALEDEKILQLAELGHKIEKYYGSEQDIEWAYVEGSFYVLQSRPITSLYPLPDINDDKFRVLMSFGHIQMMTDAMKPLAISIMSNITGFINENPSTKESNFILSAGGRMFADLTGPLLFEPSREIILKVLKGMDELLASALSQALEREGFQKLSLNKMTLFHVLRKMVPIIIPVILKVQINLHFSDPVKLRREADSHNRKIIFNQRKIMSKLDGAERIRQIKKSIGYMLPDILSKVVVYWLTGIFASKTLGKMLKSQLGEEQGAQLLSELDKSLPNNLVSEMGLELADLADTVRKYPQLINFLQNANSDSFGEELTEIEGGQKFKKALENFLGKYGMRCPGEIDITNPRWNEDPAQLFPSIISNIRTTKAGEQRKRYEQGRHDAENAEKEIVSKFSGFQRRKVRRLTKIYHNLMGMREHHKFVLVSILDIYKKAILEEAEKLVQKGVLHQKGDIFFLKLEEIIELLEKHILDNLQETIRERRNQYHSNQGLMPPRVMTSEGEIINGKLGDIQAPEGALLGIPVSAGVVEGTARVINNLGDGELNPGEILVAPFTDPGWTPLFNSASGLITEVGGMMTHGSVVAREYGLPAVVGVKKATDIIEDGDYIRVNGTDGYIEILEGKNSE